MKANFFLRLLPVLIVAFSFVLESCGPDEPPPPNPPPHLVRLPGPWNSLLGEGVAEQSSCPNQGVGCYIIFQPLPINTFNLLTNHLDILRAHVNNNTLATYFSQESNYSAIFSTLGDSNAYLLDGLINGTYKVGFLNDNTLSIYQNGVMTEANNILILFVNTQNL